VNRGFRTTQPNLIQILNIFEEMMKIAKDSFVVIEYDLRLEDGSFVKGETGPVSMNFVAGYGQLLPGLEKRLLGLTGGAEAQFVIPASEAFGEHDKNLVRTRTFDEFPGGLQLEPGKWAVAKNEDTQVQFGYFVREKTDSSVTLDYNHPLAGKDLHYRVKIVHVRQALQEELEYLRPCEHGGSSSREE
jgi:FKBP-type peptidyl-prolyl cis-trans isomerase SlyD